MYEPTFTDKPFHHGNVAPGAKAIGQVILRRSFRILRLWGIDGHEAHSGDRGVPLSISSFFVLVEMRAPFG